MLINGANLKNVDSRCAPSRPTNDIFQFMYLIHRLLLSVDSENFWFLLPPIRSTFFQEHFQNSKALILKGGPFFLCLDTCAIKPMHAFMVYGNQVTSRYKLDFIFIYESWIGCINKFKLNLEYEQVHEIKDNEIRTTVMIIKFDLLAQKR